MISPTAPDLDTPDSPDVTHKMIATNPIAMAKLGHESEYHKLQSRYIAWLKDNLRTGELYRARRVYTFIKASSDRILVLDPVQPFGTSAIIDRVAMVLNFRDQSDNFAPLFYFDLLIGDRVFSQSSATFYLEHL